MSLMNATKGDIFEPKCLSESIVHSSSQKHVLPSENDAENDVCQSTTSICRDIEYSKGAGSHIPTNLYFAENSEMLVGFGNFINSSFSDVPLGEFEEMLVRLSINDNYVGPLRLDSPLKVNKGGRERINTREDPCLKVPYSKSSIAFIPPGVLVVTELWGFFASESVSLCNHHISSMKFEHLKQCLFEHGLNQFGSTPILRRRLHEFVRRVRHSPVRNSDIDDASNGLPSTSEQGEFSCSTEVSFPPLGFTMTDANDTVNFNLLNLFNMVKLLQPLVLTPDVFYSYLLIIDLEATCDEKPYHVGLPEFPHEIIEFPVLLYDTHQRKCISVFHSFCKPKLKPILSTFCKTLTNILQTDVDKAVNFPTLLAQLENWMFVQNRLSNHRCAIVCDCNADMAKFMRIQCQISKISMPGWCRSWINLSKAFRNFYRLPISHRSTLSTMLDDLELSFAGKQHRGLDDAINILRVVQILLADGCRLLVNERIDAGRPPYFTSSVPRDVAESARGKMGSKLGHLEKRLKSSFPPTKCVQNKNSQLLIQAVSDNDKESFLWLNSVQKKRMGRTNV